MIAAPPVEGILDPENLARMVAEGFIAEKTDPHGLTLYNYTPRAQYGRVWNPETLACRGLVVREDGTVQSRPFGKFFNVDEHEVYDFLAPLPSEPFVVFEKMDGSLIVASSFCGETLLTSRGSFASEQAEAARELWAQRYVDVVIPEGETWCFEFIAPWNRIVVDYGDVTDLVLLARFDNATGLDLPLPEWPGLVVRTYDALDDFEKIATTIATLGPDDEGYVLRFASGVRAKAKGDEYKRLHRLITGISARTIWEHLADGSGVAELVDRVPDEFYAWVEQTADGLAVEYGEIEGAARDKHAEIKSLPTRKAQAFALADFEHRACVFRMLDGRDYSDVIWKTIKPAAERPFRMDEEE